MSIRDRTRGRFLSKGRTREINYFSLFCCYTGGSLVVHRGHDEEFGASKLKSHPDASR